MTKSWSDVHGQAAIVEDAVVAVGRADDLADAAGHGAKVKVFVTHVLAGLEHRTQAGF